MEFWILHSLLCSPFNCTLTISADHSISHFSSNLPSPPRSRVARGPSAASGGQPLVSSSSPTMVPTPAAAVNPPFDEVGSLVPTPSHGHRVNEEPITSVEPFEPAPQMDKGK